MCEVQPLIRLHDSAKRCTLTYQFKLTLKAVALTRLKSLLVFVFHQILGTWGIAFVAAFGLFSTFDALPDTGHWKPPIHIAHWVLTENPFYPIQIAAGVYLGWLLSRRLQHKAMLWIWVLPLASA